MIRDLSFSVAFGIASTALLSFSLLGAGGQATSGNALQTMSLMTLSVIPLFLSGLGWGLASAAIAILTGAVIAGLFVDPEPGPVLANYGLDDLRFLAPVSPGETLTVRLTAKSKKQRNDQYGEVNWDVEVIRSDGKAVATYTLLTMNAI